MPTLVLPDTPRSAVWRLLVAQLRADPVLGDAPGCAGVVRTWRIPDGDPEVWASIEDDSLSPALRLIPEQGPLTWFDASGQRGYLVVNIEAWIAGHDAEDYLNLQGAIEYALYPAEPAYEAFREALVAAGALTGIVELTRPIERPVVGDYLGGFRMLGQMQVEVLIPMIR